jgi:hypothetical protein
MDRSSYQTESTRMRIFDPPLMTLIVYGGVLVVYQLGELNTPMGRLLLIPALLGVLIVPIVTARSLGHTLMSVLGGGKLLRLTSGPFQIDRVNDQLKFGLNLRWARYPGSAITAPEPGIDLRRWVRWRETGSFIGMVAYVLFILVLSNWLRGQGFIAESPERARMVETIAFGVAVLVITLGVWQLVNRHVPRMWRMFRSKEGAEREASIIAMTSLIMVGERPRVWPSEWVELAVWDEDKSVEGLYGHRFAYLHALDSGDLEAADRHFQYLDDHSDRLPNRMREHIVDLERPFVEAWIRKDAETARELMNNMGNRIVDRYRVRRVQAAVALAQGEYQVAREYAVEGLNASAGKMHDGEVRAEAAVLEEILRLTGGDVGETASEESSEEIDASEAASTGGATPRH